MTALYEQGIGLRLEIKSAELQLEISAQNIQEQKSRYLPTIDENYSLYSFYVDTETASLSEPFKAVRADW